MVQFVHLDYSQGKAQFFENNKLSSLVIQVMPVAFTQVQCYMQI